MVIVVSVTVMGEPMKVEQQLQVLMRLELKEYRKQLAKHLARKKLWFGDSYPPRRCRRRRKSRTTKPPTALTGVGVMNAWKHSAANGLIMELQLDMPGAFRLSIWITHS